LQIPAHHSSATNVNGSSETPQQYNNSVSPEGKTSRLQFITVMHSLTHLGYCCVLSPKVPKGHFRAMTSFGGESADTCHSVPHLLRHSPTRSHTVVAVYEQTSLLSRAWVRPSVVYLHSALTKFELLDEDVGANLLFGGFYKTSGFHLKIFFDHMVWKFLLCVSIWYV